MKAVCEAIDMAIEALSAERTGDTDKELKYMRQRNAELETMLHAQMMLNAQKAISADAVQGEWIKNEPLPSQWAYKCNQCGCPSKSNSHRFCPNCGSRMTPYQNRMSELYIEVRVKDDPGTKAEKLYQICEPEELEEVAKYLDEYIS